MKFKTVRKCLCQYCAYPLTDPKAMEQHEAGCLYADVDWNMEYVDIARKLGFSRQRVWHVAQNRKAMRQVKPLDKKRAA